MENSMTQDEIDACRMAFEKFDADGSGTIEPNELKAVLVMITAISLDTIVSPPPHTTNARSCPVLSFSVYFVCPSSSCAGIDGSESYR